MGHDDGVTTSRKTNKNRRDAKQCPVLRLRDPVASKRVTVAVVWELGKILS